MVRPLCQIAGGLLERHSTRLSSTDDPPLCPFLAAEAGLLRWQWPEPLRNP